MHPLLTFLAVAVRYTNAFADDAGPLRVVRLHDILKHVCKETLSQPQIETLTHTLDRHIAVGQQPLPSLNEQVAEGLMTRTLNDQLARVAAVLRDLIALREALNGEYVQRLSLQVSDRLLFDAIRSLVVYQGEGQMRQVLVGTLEGMNDEPVGPFPRQRLLAQIGIVYQAASPLPQLNLSVGSRSNVEAWEAGRTRFSHRVGERYDLTLGPRQGNPRGQIKTRSSEGSWRVSNPVYELIPAPKLKLTLVQTDILDEHENQALICVRVAASDRN
jgi:hypothetical protein